MQEDDGQCIGLAPLRLADQSLFVELFSRLACPISDYSFACTHIWSASLKLYQARLHRHLCLFANGTGDLTMLTPPLPEPGSSPEDLSRSLRECFRIMDDYNRRGPGLSRSRVEYISEEMLDYVRSAPGFDFDVQPMGMDYVYDTARMIDLAGGAYKSKRSARSKFMREFPAHRTERLMPAHREACRALLLRWQQQAEARHGTSDPAADPANPGQLRRREVAACEFALEQADGLGLKGMTLWVGDRLAGFTLGEALTSRQCSILIEKTDPDFPGAPQYIFSEFCRQYWAEYPECNAGDDCGMPSLRFTKESYRPIRRLPKFALAHRQEKRSSPAPVLAAQPETVCA